jgi:hypothetical protein
MLWQCRVVTVSSPNMDKWGSVQFDDCCGAAPDAQVGRHGPSPGANEGLVTWQVPGSRVVVSMLMSGAVVWLPEEWDGTHLGRE